MCFNCSRSVPTTNEKGPRMTDHTNTTLDSEDADAVYCPPRIPYENDPDRFRSSSDWKSTAKLAIKMAIALAFLLLVLKFFIEFTGKADGAMPMLTPAAASARSLDVNGDGVVNDSDLAAFKRLFEAGDIGADFDGDGFVTGDDYDAFVLAFDPGDGWTVYPLADGAVEFRCSTDAQVKEAWTKIDRARGDRILLEAGRTFGPLGKLPFAGSPDRPMLIGRFGDGPNPIVQCKGTQAGVECSGGGGSPPAYYLQLVGLDIRTTRAGNEPASGIFFGRGGSISIEGCRVSGFADNLNIQGPASSPAKFRLHRSYIGDSYSRDGSHSQGIYLQDLASAEITENTFFHNGYLDEADRTIFNHNTYLSRGVRKVVYRDNLSVAASATGLCCNYESVFEGNLVVDCPVGIFFRPGSTVTNNVVIGSADIAPDIQRGMGINLLGVHEDGGAPDGPVGPARIEGNIVASKNAGVGREAAFIINANNDGIACSVFVKDNIVFDWPSWPTVLGGVDVEPTTPPKGNADSIAVDGHQYASKAFPLSSWPSPGRTLDGYAKSIGLKDQGEFMARASMNRIGAWDEKLTGRAARAWIAEGYGR